MTEPDRATSDQAARLAAIRARRGQAPVDPLLATQTPQTSHEVWMAPPLSRTASTTATATGTQPTPIIAVRPAATGRSTAPATATSGRTKRPHVAAGARIVMTGVAASSVFGLTAVLAAANRPVVAPADSSIGAAPLVDATTTTNVPTTTLVPLAPDTVAPTVLPTGQVVTLTVPSLIVAPTASVPAPLPATPPAAPSASNSGGQAAPAPAAAAPAPAAPAPAPAAAPAPAEPAPVIVVTAPPAPPAPPATQPPPPATTKPSG